MIDSHVHLDDEKFDYDRENLIKNLKEHGLDRVYNIGADLKSSIASVELADKYEIIKAVIGIHPHAASEYNQEVEDKLIELAKMRMLEQLEKLVWTTTMTIRQGISKSKFLKSKLN